MTWRDRLNHRTMHDRTASRGQPELWSDRSANGMVATAHWAATRAGVEILEAGGNAVDAAAAASFALGVAEPSGSGLGGMAQFVLHLAATARTFAVLGPCRAPRRGPRHEGAGSDELAGYATIAIPIHPAALGHVLDRYGTMPLREVLVPAVRLAREGHLVSAFQHQLAAAVLEPLASGTAGAFFLDDLQRPMAPGTLLRQPVLANTLERLAHAGIADFYRGDIALSIAADMAANGGWVGEEDLRAVGAPPESGALVAPLLRGTAHAFPPPGGGATLLQQLLLFEQLAPQGIDPDSPEGAMLFAAIGRRAEADRRGRPAAPVQMDACGTPVVLVAGELRRTERMIRDDLEGGTETSHLSVLDRHGNAVALTQSINHAYGAKCATADLGFPYNCYLGDFNTSDPNHPYYLRPGAMARSNATPTIIISDGKPVIAIGAAGERRMLSILLQVLVRLRKSSPYEAIAAPRMFCDQIGNVRLEADRWSDEVIDHLRQRGFAVKRWDSWSFKAGAVQLAMADQDGFEGAADPRRDGAAAGYRRQKVG